MSATIQAYKNIIYACAEAMSPEAVERLLQRALLEDPDGFEEYLRRFASGAIPEAERAYEGLKRKRIPSQLTLDKILRTWEKLQVKAQQERGLRALVKKLGESDAGQELTTLFTNLDPQISPDLNFQTAGRLLELSKLLKQKAQALQEDPEKFTALDQLGIGLADGIQAAEEVQRSVLTWIYEPQTPRMSFALPPSPWGTWSQGLSHPLNRAFFEALDRGEVQNFVGVYGTQLDLKSWVELSLLLRYTEFTLLEVFDQRVMSEKATERLAVSTFLTIVSIWSELAFHLQSSNPAFSKSAFQVALYILRSFAQRSYFPRYGLILLSLSGGAVGEAIAHLAEPLRETVGSADMAKIYNLLGFTFRFAGRTEEAKSFLERAISWSREAQDSATEAACTTNLGCILQDIGQPREAITLHERALVLVRMVGDPRGEAYIKAHLGQALGAVYRYPEALELLERSLETAQNLEDPSCIVLALTGLGSVYLEMDRPSEALIHLERSLDLAQRLGDFRSGAQSLLLMAEVYKALEQYRASVLRAAQALSLLASLKATGQRQACGLLTVLQGKMGEEAFAGVLEELKPELEKSLGRGALERLRELWQEPT
jgi:tetratricopeptide (TPR) repeat protein